MPISEVFNMDCVAYMQTLPDKFFDLSIVDPPYGINHSTIAGKQSGEKYGKAAAAKKNYTLKDWDKCSPDLYYFEELKRVSKNYIIWGANHFVSKIGLDGSGWIFWDKDNGDNNFSDGELAYTSFDVGLRKVKVTWNGMIQHDMKNKETRIHPTQKPIALYKWLIEKYAKSGDKIFDSHMGSQSSRIAAFNMGFDYWGCELDEEYFNDGNKRFIRETMQQSLFTPTATKAEITQTTIF